MNKKDYQKSIINLYNILMFICLDDMNCFGKECMAVSEQETLSKFTLRRKLK